MLTNYLVLDVATAPIEGAAGYLEGSIKAPANYKDLDKIAAYVAEKQAERLALAAVDVDLARITAVGLCALDVVSVYDARSEEEERALLTTLVEKMDVGQVLVTYGGFNFDLPLLMRRARYLGVDFPTINLDKYRSPHLDVCEWLSDRNPQRRRPLTFYTKRLGWSDLTKPLSGADEARVFETGQWQELVDSVYHDVTALHRLAGWLGLIGTPIDEPVV
jgi:RNase_H superfamily